MPARSARGSRSPPSTRSSGRSCSAISRRASIRAEGAQLAYRTLGDTTLLITYDQPLGYDGAELRIGGIEAVDTASEMGFMAVASGAGLRIEETVPLPPALIRIPRDELPAGYAATVTAPLLAVYKYTRRPHAATLRVTALETQPPIDQVVDYLALNGPIRPVLPTGPRVLRQHG